MNCQNEVLVINTFAAFIPRFSIVTIIKCFSGNFPAQELRILSPPHPPARSACGRDTVVL